MKTILIILDGVGDRDCKELKGSTPLKAAETPNLDWFAEQGKTGLMIPVKEDFAPESDQAVTSILGYKDHIIAMRGPLEVIGIGLKLQEGDLALRTNFATINNIREGKIIDRRAGRTLTTKEASILAKAINSQVKLPAKFLFRNTIQHRGILIIRGGLSDNITNTDPAYHVKGSYELYDTLHYSRALDDDEISEYSANIINQFIEKTYSVLAYHPINQQRVKQKMLPANIILTRDGGASVPSIQKLEGKWAAIVYMPLEIGIAKIMGMQPFSFRYPEMKEANVYRNLYGGLNAAIAFSKKILQKQIKNYDYFYIHFKETDVPGHDNRPEEKKKMIEVLDRDFFAFLRQIASKEKIRVIVTADHATPCSLKAHSADAVPILVYGEGRDETRHFSEKAASKGKIGKIYGKDVMKFIKE